MRKILNTLLISTFLLSCMADKDRETESSLLFTLLPASETGIDFENNVVYEEEFNVYTYRNFYNGAGVGIGDINNDGLADIYFCGNQESNRLYLNKGDFKFEDITEKAGVACQDVWSTGVSMADINGDGFLDIFVSKSGGPEGNRRHNELFINNGDLSFTESAAEYGLADIGLTNHAAFFDYDKDGDLDCYLLNNSFNSFAVTELKKDLRMIRDPDGANKLYRNEDGRFVDVSASAGIFGSAIGFGLGVTIGDVNRDGWQDIYVSNDFFERDYLYINNQDGTFSELLEDQIRETSLGSMGADMADINNDGYPEIFVTEMLPSSEDRLKTKAMFESWERYQFNVRQGYHHQFARNVLQLNNQDDTFSEIGRLAGVEATDWSWSALIWDMDNDGRKDIFVANGIYKDLLDQDYIGLYTDPNIVRKMIREEDDAIIKLIDAIPSEQIANFAFRNDGNLSFTDHADHWGLGILSHSNGSAYGDLDNDGDLDLVINNVNMPAFIYRNNSNPREANHYLQIKLAGDRKNTNAIGTQVELRSKGEIYFQEMMPTRGFMSSVDPVIHFGLGNLSSIDSVIVFWPDEKVSLLTDVPVNQRLELRQSETVLSRIDIASQGSPEPLFSDISSDTPLNYRHIENDFIDFERNRLLYHMMSTEGPKIDRGDVNGDGLEDVFIGGAKNFPGSLMVQQKDGTLKATNTDLFLSDKVSEDTECLFFDADNDQDLDLYVASGGIEFSSSSAALLDRLYLNDGNGVFRKSDQRLPDNKFESTSCVTAADFDADGDQDLFVGIRFIPFLYGVPASGYILENDGQGHFTNVTAEIAPALKDIGMITDAVWTDIEGNEAPDLVIVGDWMPVTVFTNENGKLVNTTETLGLLDTRGWWNTIETADLDLDGDMDFVLGNHGLNSRFRCSIEQPIKLYVNDFDQNGSVEHIITMFNGDQAYPFNQQDDLVQQIPSLESRYPTHDAYKEQTITDIFTEEILNASVVQEINTLSTMVLLNDLDRGLHMQELPVEAQFSPMYSILIRDFNEDAIPDILMGGNFSKAKPEAGKYDASYGCLLIGNGKGSFAFLPNRISGLNISGEVRDFDYLEGMDILVVARNNDSVKVFKHTK